MYSSKIEPLAKRILNSKFNFFVNKKREILLFLTLYYLAIIAFLYFSSNNLHLAYNDAMSHLNIARRVFDNLQPGIAQLGSVWLPLPHLLMLPTVWIYFFWQTGLSAAIIAMASYVITSFYTFKIVEKMTQSYVIGLFSAGVVALNINFLYIQTTALTEPLFMAFFAMGIYYFYLWTFDLQPVNLVIVGILTFLMTLTRYDGWFVFGFMMFAVFLIGLCKSNYKKAEGLTILYATIGGIGIIFWILYNFVIFNDPFYFALGEFSAKSQQELLLEAGELNTKGNIFFSLKTYFFALINNIGVGIVIIAFLGFIYYLIKEKSIVAYIFVLVLLATIIFNVVALYLGFSVIFLPEVTGNSWFNVRYGLIGLPIIAIFIGYLLGTRGILYIFLVPAIVIFQMLQFYSSGYAVTVIDGTLGSSQKNVRPIGNILHNLYLEDKGFILGSAASHDAIFFTSGISLNQFIHEGVEKYWQPSLANPQLYAKYVIMRTNDNLDSVCRALCKIPDFNEKYQLRYDGDFADIYKRRE